MKEQAQFRALDIKLQVEIAAAPAAVWRARPRSTARMPLALRPAQTKRPLGPLSLLQQRWAVMRDPAFPWARRPALSSA